MREISTIPTPGAQKVLPQLDGFVAWAKSREAWLLGGAAAFHVGLLAVMIAMRVTLLTTGETIVLRVIPVDPRSLFSGDYVILSYDISQMLPEGIEQNRQNKHRGETVYVTLVPEGDGVHWRGERASFTQPSSGRFIRGTIAGWNRVEFGIESYFVQEGEGRKIEEVVRERRLSAEISLTADGTAALKGLRFE